MPKILKPTTVPDDAYASGWDGSVEVPTKNALYDKIETLLTGASSSVDNALVASGPCPRCFRTPEYYRDLSP